MKLKFALVALVLVLCGCKKGDGLVVVTLTATPTITNVNRIHVDMTVGSTRRSHEIAGVTAVDGSGATTFGIDVSAEFGSSITLGVHVLDSSGAQIGEGSGTAQVTAGKQTVLTIPLSSNGSLSGDMGGQADLSGVPQCTFDDQNFDNCVLAP